MLTQDEITSRLRPNGAKSGTAPCTSHDAVFNIVLATDAMIYALDRGQDQLSTSLNVSSLRNELENLRNHLSEA